MTEATGDCFVIGFHIIMGWARNAREQEAIYILSLADEGSKRLVHGDVVRSTDRLVHQHCWFELCLNGIDYVLSYANDSEVLVKREIYYAVGEIREDRLTRYTREEANAHALKDGTYGPWPLDEN